MKQLHTSFTKNQHEFSHPSYFNISSKNKPKQNINAVASKSFSESFLNQCLNKKYTKNHKEEKSGKDDTISRSLNTKTKKLSEHNISLNSKNEKKQGLLSAFDNKILQDAIKAKSQSQNLNSSIPSNFRYLNIDRPS